MEAGFQALYVIDAYLHLKDGIAYPAMMATHGLNDPRVDAWHLVKFVAEAQATTACDSPILLHIDYGAGHGVDSTKSQYLKERADIFAFIWSNFKS